MGSFFGSRGYCWGYRRKPRTYIVLAKSVRERYRVEAGLNARVSSPRDTSSTLITSAPKSAQDNKTELLAKVVVIMGVAAQFKDRQSPLEDLLHRIMADKSEHDKSVLHQRYVEVCETLIDGLVDASDLPGFVSTLYRLYVESRH